MGPAKPRLYPIPVVSVYDSVSGIDGITETGGTTLVKSCKANDVIQNPRMEVCEPMDSQWVAYV